MVGAIYFHIWWCISWLCQWPGAIYLRLLVGSFGRSFAVTFSVLMSTPFLVVFRDPSTTSISHGIFLRKLSASGADIHLVHGPAVQACSDGSSLLPVTCSLRSAAWSGSARSMRRLPHNSMHRAPFYFLAISVVSFDQSAGISMQGLLFRSSAISLSSNLILSDIILCQELVDMSAAYFVRIFTNAEKPLLPLLFS